MLRSVDLLYFLLSESIQNSETHTSNYNCAAGIGIENSTYRQQIRVLQGYVVIALGLMVLHWKKVTILPFYDAMKTDDQLRWRLLNLTI